MPAVVGSSEVEEAVLRETITSLAQLLECGQRDLVAGPQPLGANEPEAALARGSLALAAFTFCCSGSLASCVVGPRVLYGAMLSQFERRELMQAQAENSGARSFHTGLRTRLR